MIKYYLVLAFFSCAVLFPHYSFAEKSRIKIGLISPLTGPLAAFAPSEGTVLAIEELNAEGGIDGRQIELLIEDGRGDGKSAALAAQKLIQVDGVKFILGGQSSVETLAIAPIMKKYKVIAIASMSTSPAIAHAGEFMFRTSPNSLKQGEVLAKYARETGNYKSISIFAEESPYALPIVEGFSSTFKRLGGSIPITHEFNTATTDFRSLVTGLSSNKSDAVLLAAQSIPLAAQIVRQMRQLGVTLPILGTETVGNVLTAWPQYADLFEGCAFAQPDFNLKEPRTIAMIERYNKRFGGIGLKYPYQAEAYDAAKLMAKTIERCGEDSEKVRKCLQTLKGYPGVSGEINFDENGDAIRAYALHKISGTKVIDIES